MAILEREKESHLPFQRRVVVGGVLDGVKNVIHVVRGGGIVESGVKKEGKWGC